MENALTRVNVWTVKIAKGNANPVALLPSEHKDVWHLSMGTLAWHGAQVLEFNQPSKRELLVALLRRCIQDWLFVEDEVF